MADESLNIQGSPHDKEVRCLTTTGQSRQIASSRSPVMKRAQSPWEYSPSQTIESSSSLLSPRGSSTGSSPRSSTGSSPRTNSPRVNRTFSKKSPDQTQPVSSNRRGSESDQVEDQEIRPTSPIGEEERLGRSREGRPFFRSSVSVQRRTRSKSPNPTTVSSYSTQDVTDTPTILNSNSLTFVTLTGGQSSKNKRSSLSLARSATSDDFDLEERFTFFFCSFLFFPKYYQLRAQRPERILFF